MATESPMRFVETSGNFGPSSDNMAARELGLLPKDQRFLKNGRNMGPNRSESAPPSIEGSFAAIQNFMSQQKFSLNDRLEDLKLAYHSSNVDLNPRFRIHRIGSLGNDWRLKSFDDSRNDSLHLSESTLSIHEEKSEEDRSPQQARDEWAERNSGYLSEQDSASSGENKLLVDVLQEDYTRSSSPVYNKFRSFSHDSVEEAFVEADPSSFHDPSISTSNAIISTPGAYDTGLSPKPDSLATHVSGPSPFDRKEGEPAKPPLYRRRSNTKNADLEDQVLSSCVSVSDSTRIESEMKATDNSILPNSDNHKNQREPPQQVLLHQRLAFEVPGAKSQMTSPGISHSYMGTNQFPYGLSNFSSAAYMNSLNPFYHHMHPSSYFCQYGIGGYALNNTGYPPFIPGYPQNAIPMAFDGSTGPSFRAQAYGVSTGEITKNAVDMQHINNFYGQLGFSVKPSLTDPLHHFQQPSADTYNHGVGGPGNINSRRVGPTSPYYFGNPVNSGVLMHFPTSPIATPVLPGSTAGGTHFPRVKTELRLQPGSDRNVGIYSGWQSQRAPESFVDTKSSSFLEELRSGKGRRFELVDIAGQIVEFSADQHGSRFIQQKLENCSGEVKASVFREVLPHASSLITDVFGNYVIQKFFDYGSPEQRKELANKLEGQILPLSLQMYGCRVIQKALEVIELEQKIKLIHELDGHVTSCVRDQNGNHVIQKCIESIPTDQIGFIISAFRGQVATLAMHPYGCRVIQRLLERCTDDLQSQFIVDEILESIYALAQDQYGNYVTQHVLGRGKPHERSQIINKLSGHIGQMSQHKFASNVVEKCLEHSDSASREILIGEIIGHTEENENLLTMMKDQYANYVVQKILETCTNDQREMLLCHISTHLDALKKYTYGKHIAARFEQLYGEEIQTTRP